MEQRDVKLRVELEVVGGQGATDQPGVPGASPQPSNPAAPASPGTAPPDAGAGRGTAPPPSLAPGQYPSTTPGTSPEADLDPSDDRSPREEEIERRVANRLRQEMGQAVGTATGGGGRLSDQAVGLAAAGLGAIPAVGGALAAGVRAAEFAERYGAAALAAAAQALPEEAREPLRRAAAIGEDLVRKIASGRSALDAIGPAFEQTRDVAAGQVLFNGETDPAFLARYGRNTYAVTRVQLEAEAARRQRGTAATGAAIGDLLGKALAEGMGVGR